MKLGRIQGLSIYRRGAAREGEAQPSRRCHTLELPCKIERITQSFVRGVYGLPKSKGTSVGRTTGAANSSQVIRKTGRILRFIVGYTGKGNRPHRDGIQHSHD